MSVFVVTWNLNKEKPNYSQARDAFLKDLNSYETTRDPGLETVSFVSTVDDIGAVNENLRKHLDANDRLLVTKMNNGQYQGWLSKDVWDWISVRL